MNADATPRLSAERPFPGLRPFNFEDCHFFFGREQQVGALYRLLDFSRFIAVVGTSGSGKSSLVRAGLLPQLQAEGQQPGGRRWRFATMHPGEDPTRALAEELSSLAPGTSSGAEILECLQRSSFGLLQAREGLVEIGDDPIFLIVDQFEELFRYAAISVARADEVAETLWHDRAGHFVQLLLEATRSRSAEIFVLITIRSDFIGDCAQFQHLPEAVSASQFLVPGLTRDQRESVIRKPIEKAAETLAHASIETALVQRLLNDIGDGLDQLPVLQHCLSRLWERAGGEHLLTVEHYIEVGEITDALSRHADEIMESLPGLEVAVEQLFRALSEVDKEGRATRRPVPYGQLVDECGVPEEQLRTVVDRYRADDCSFLVPSLANVPVLRPDTRVDVGHEALLRHWNRISRGTVTDGEQGWLWDEERDGRRYRALLVTSNVPRAQALAYAEWWGSRPRTPAWAERYGGQFASIDALIADTRKEYFEDQRKEREAAQTERASQRRRILQTRLFAAAMALIALIAVWFGVSASAARQASFNQETIANATLAAMEEMIAVSAYQGPTLEEKQKDDEEYRKQLPQLANPTPDERRRLDPILTRLQPVIEKAYGVGTPFSFYVTKGSAQDPGAYAFYGPRIYISAAMIGFADRPEELAGILCHVSAHIVNHAGAQADRLKEQPTQAAGAYDRAEEVAADMTGATLCDRAGLNPWGLDWLLRKLRDHPGFDEEVDAQRIESLENYLHRPEYRNWLQHQTPVAAAP